jgi:predicted dehydrogenase
MNLAEPTQGRGFVVAGLGKMGIMHASMLGVVTGGRLAALVDRDAKLCQQVRSMGHDVPTFTDLAQCIDQIHPEGVIIATPQFTHRALVETCLKSNTPVFCEKPLAHTLADARAMARAARPEVPVAVGFMLAHNPLFERAGRMASEGKIGEIKSFKASCRLSQVFSPKQGWTFTLEWAGGGVLINSGCHLLFVLQRLFGRPKGLVVRGGGVHNEVEDTLAALIDYPSGVWGAVEVTWSVPGHEIQTHDIEITGSGGTIEVGNDWLRLWLSQAGKDEPAGWSQWRREELQPKAPFTLSPDFCGDEFFLEIQDFVESVRQGRRPKVGVEEALGVQETLDACYRSMPGGDYVALTPVEEGTQ